MTKHFPQSPLGTTMISVDQLEWLLQITGTSRSYLFQSLLSHSASWQWDMVSVRQALSQLFQFAFLSDVLCQYLFHPVQIVIKMSPTIDLVISSHHLGGYVR